MEKTAMIRELLFCLDMERRQTLRPKFEKLGLTPGQPGVLKALLKKTEITQKELAQMCHVDQTTLSRNLDKLVQLGYVERKTDEECRRCFLISLTPTGSEKAKERVEALRGLLIQELQDREEGFVREGRLVTGCKPIVWLTKGK